MFFLFRNSLQTYLIQHQPSHIVYFFVSSNLFQIPLVIIISLLNPQYPPIPLLHLIRPHEHASRRLTLKIPFISHPAVVFARRLVEDDSDPRRACGAWELGYGTDVGDGAVAGGRDSAAGGRLEICIFFEKEKKNGEGG